MTEKRNPGADLREDVRETIERAWPDGVVEMAFNSDESYFWDVYPKLEAAIQRLKGARLVHEHKPEGGLRPSALPKTDRGISHVVEKMSQQRRRGPMHPHRHPFVFNRIGLQSNSNCLH